LQHPLYSEFRLLGMTFHKNPSPRGLDSAVSNDMNRVDDDDV